MNGASRQPANRQPDGPAPAAVDRRSPLIEIWDLTLDLVRDIGQSIERGDIHGAVVRCLIIVEMLLAAIAFGVIIALAWQAHAV